jgi:SAM-dependent methyltransferase
VDESLGSTKPPPSNPVDEAYGTDTATGASLHELTIDSPNYQWGVYYRATKHTLMEELLAALPINREEYTFVDYGSGKGLVLLLAAGYPFKKVIGVEFACELHEIARRNIELYPTSLRHSEIELVWGDIVDYTPPSGNLILYLYEPFEAPVTRKVIARIREFRQRGEVVIAYVWSTNPMISCKAIWDNEGSLRKVAQGERWTIYRAI